MRRSLVFVPLMATLSVMGQLQHPQPSVLPEDPVNLPFSTISQFIFPTTPSTRSSSRRFAFAFAARTTTTVLPQVMKFSPSTVTNRASIRFITTIAAQNCKI
jgi:hypothetical protein